MKCIRILKALALLSLCLIFSPSAFANNVTVGCAGAVGTFDFNTLQAALDALHAASNRNHLITVSGTCAEASGIFDFENLQVIGTPGATVLDPGPNSPGNPGTLLGIGESKNISIQGITFQGLGAQGRTLTVVTDSINIIFDHCIFQDSSTGVFLNEGSIVHLTATVLQNNNMGSRISGSEMTMGAPNGGPEQSYVQNNGVGIQIDENAQMDVWTTSTIQNNGEGIIVNGGRLRFCCGGNIQVLNNLFGLDVNYGTMDMLGPVTVQGNTFFGIRLSGSSASINGGTVIQQNGNGIVALGNSHLTLFNSQVTNNTGNGVVLRDNSSGQLSGNTITGNAVNGVILFVLSSASINGGTIANNGGAAVTCSFHSIAYEEDTRIKRLCSEANDDLSPGK